MKKLVLYNKKRKFDNTPEPPGKIEKSSQLRFVIQKHDASHLHYDFRLELQGVLKSWAVPKGVPETGGEKRLAVHVEDHPVSYINFKGIIPKGNYGAGTVEIFDKGKYIPVDDKEEPISENAAAKNIDAGELKLIIKGKKITGSYVLVRLKKDEKNWLLIKHTEKKKTAAVPGNKTPFRYRTPIKVKDFITPMLAHTGDAPFDDKEWVYEIKWDGYRAIAVKHKEVQLYSRNGNSYEERFPSVFAALHQLKHACVLDGEIVWLNENGTANFQALQNFDGSTAGNIIYQVFDLLSLDNQPTTSLTLLQRKELLKKLLGKNKLLHYSEHIQGDGIAFFDKVKAAGLEGIMAKDGNSEYHIGVRTKSWMKLKNIQTADVTVMGYTAPKGSRKNFGSLILGIKKKSGWQFCGHVGTGFNQAMLEKLFNMAAPLPVQVSPFKGKVPVNDIPVWVKPIITIEISFTEQTKEGIFRHPAFIKLRDDKMNSGAIAPKKIKEKTASEDTVTAGKISVPVSNYNKVYWPDEGYTKGEVIEFYKTMATYILPHLKDRPLSLKRNPNGIADKGFYHKDAGENTPDYVKVFPYKNEEKTIDYIVCNNAPTLLYLANLGCIEMNPWNNRYNKTDRPDWLAIDLDPGKDNTFKQVVETAQVAKAFIDKAKLSAWCKTSGASGLHIYIPLNAQYDYDVVRQFGEFFMMQVQEQLPGSTTIERTISKRGKRIYLDFLQNRRGQTLASVYSIRPVPGATVSTPIEWKELKTTLHPSDFTIKNAFKRTEKKGDLFKPVLTEKNNLIKALKLLSE